MAKSNHTPDILQKIVARKKQEVEQRQTKKPLQQLKAQSGDADKVRGFIQSIENKLKQGKAAVIAEIKKASPSKGILRADFQPTQIAKSYAQHGAACLSVLTDKDFFQGSEKYLQQARDACTLPVIRKDFIIEPYQVYEARVINADCILLIVAILNDEKLQELYQLATELKLDVLMEVHDAQEMQRALKTKARLIGINNRNLRTFETSLETSLNLQDMLQANQILVTESGIHRKQDVALMQKNNINTFLVGEAFMRAKNPGEKLAELFS